MSDAASTPGSPTHEPAAPGSEPDTSAPAKTAPRKKPAAPARDQGITWLKEMVTTILAIAIASVTLGMLVGTYRTASEPLSVTEGSTPEIRQAEEKLRLERKSGQKDILLIATGLLGAVIGYYFGRVPAERMAERAETVAADAQETANQAQSSQKDEEAARKAAEAKIADARKVLQDALRKYPPEDTEPGPATGERSRARTPTATYTEVSAAVPVQLRDLLSRLD